MATQSTPEWTECLYLCGFSESDKQRQYKSYGINPCETILMAWSLYKTKKSNRAFIVTDRKIRYVHDLKMNDIRTIDISDIISVDFDGKSCINFRLISIYPNAISIPTKQFFKGVKLGNLTQEQFSFLDFLAKTLNIIVKNKN